jgi:hypothetical protein
MSLVMIGVSILVIGITIGIALVMVGWWCSTNPERRVPIALLAAYILGVLTFVFCAVSTLLFYAR